MNSLKDKVILITGASKGIGKATAIQLSERGANLVLASRDYAALDGVAAEVKRLGGRAVTVPTDVTQQTQVADLVSEAVATFGHIDALVNCAGVGVLRAALELTEEDIDRCYAVNTKGSSSPHRRLPQRCLKRKAVGSSHPLAQWGDMSCGGARLIVRVNGQR